jgi:drug/metabolite transporter (DMT)-like permease
MIVLLLSIVCATYLVICFRYFQHFGIQNLHAIVFNYITCVITGLWFSGLVPDVPKIVSAPWFPFAAVLGCSFFCIFNLMGYVANHVGVTVTSVASKLSMVIPVTVAAFIYDDAFGWIKIAAIALALIAVIFTSRTQASIETHLELKGLMLVLLIFFGSGINDTMVNFASVKLMKPEEFNIFNVVIFFFASITGVIALSTQIIFQKKRVPFKAVLGGIALGIPNYFSLLFLIRALHLPGWSSSVIFPINNLGIVILTAVCAYVLFREKLTPINLAGIATALLAIGLMIFA